MTKTLSGFTCEARPSVRSGMARSAPCGCREDSVRTQNNIKAAPYMWPAAPMYVCPLQLREPIQGIGRRLHATAIVYVRDSNSSPTQLLKYGRINVAALCCHGTPGLGPPNRPRQCGGDRDTNTSKGRGPRAPSKPHGLGWGSYYRRRLEADSRSPALEALSPQRVFVLSRDGIGPHIVRGRDA